MSFNSIQAQVKSESIEDWETGDMSQFNWITGGTSDWVVNSQFPYEGNYSARSGDLLDSQASWLSLVYDVYSAENISFWFRVSSESGWDYLRFYIDGGMIDEWSGELPWMHVAYPVSVGTHTFKWEYSKDGSISSGSDAAWLDYIIFPPMELEALFITDTTVFCENEMVSFYDESVGPITEWNWVFEGGTPNTSTEQNPVITYENDGIWDVTLEVSDGVESSSLFLPDFITINSVPEMAPTPTGITLLCASWGSSSYSTAGLNGITSYTWLLEPEEAGMVVENDIYATVIWDEEFIGDATLQVSGINDCGIGIYSNPLNITVYLPEVSLSLISNVNISTQPFELTGGLPEGGEYSGTGVIDGIFYPETAGLGDHIITYTYTDQSSCTNSSDAIITVTEFTGVFDQSTNPGIFIYPNPNHGNFTIKANFDINHKFELKIYNSLNKIVYQQKDVNINKEFSKNINLNNFAKGIYYLHITGDKSDFVGKILIR